MTERLKDGSVPGCNTSPAESFIVNPYYDCAFFILSPLFALSLGIAIAGSPFANYDTCVLGKEAPLTNILIGTLIMAHLVIVFFRTHLNQNVFRTHPIRFTVAPLVLFVAMTMSQWVAVIVAVLAVWWDVYHSSMQTFGLGRIYDVKKGNSTEVGRSLDKWLNLLLYAGPILAGATLMEHMEGFSEFKNVGSLFFTSIPVTVERNRGFLTWAVVAIGVPFLMFYAYRYWLFHRRGYQVSIQKVALFISTGVCSIYTWGFNSFGQAFFIMNFFHAVQYFAIVWWTEKRNIASVLGLQESKWGKPIALIFLLMCGFSYGLWAEISDRNNEAAYNLIMVIVIMHFWYDGFIWSVRKKQV